MRALGALARSAAPRGLPTQARAYAAATQTVREKWGLPGPSRHGRSRNRAQCPVVPQQPQQPTSLLQPPAHRSEPAADQHGVVDDHHTPRASGTSPTDRHTPPVASTSARAAASPTSLPDFTRPTWGAASTVALARSWAVLAACTVGSGQLAKRSDTLLSKASSILGTRAVDAAVRATFFRVFCAGEGLEEAVEREKALRAAGVRGILNYAAEAAVAAEGDLLGSVSPADAAADARARTFLEAVAATDTSPLSDAEAAAGGGIGVTAIKVTALGCPDALERASSALVCAGGHAAAVDRWAGLPPATQGGLPAVRHRLGQGGLGPADLVSWDATVARVAAIADAAAARAASTGGGLRLILDAEQTWVQPAIDALAIALMARHNAPGAAFSILQTYQHNLVATPARLAADAARAEREGWILGAKPVRGAYLVSERARAAAAGTPDPVCPTAAATHAAYDAAITRLVPSAADGATLLMVATHNQASVETTARAMAAASLQPSTPAVLFGQLFGMRDFLTFTLGAAGYRAYKILPYGPLRETLLYLTRRAQENSDVLGNVGVDLQLLRAELGRRVLGMKGG